MNLLEYEGKALLSRHGVRVPHGELWPAVPPSARGWVVKAQAFTGSRGMGGGIRVVETADEVDRTAEVLRGSTVNGRQVESVWVEERLEIAREIFLAAFINRSERRVTIVVSDGGGVDVESVAPERIATMNIDPLIGPADFQLRELTAAFGRGSTLAARLAAVIGRVYAALVAEDAELIEINPLVVTDDGDLVAADAKIVLDDDAASRHPERATPVAWQIDGDFMQRCRELGVIAVDTRTPQIGGGAAVSILANGAGLSMATLDQVVLDGLPVCGLVELHGALARGVEHTAEVFRALFTLKANVVLVNAFYQLRSCEDLALALVSALGSPGAPSPDHIIVRMRSVDQQTARAIVEAAGCQYAVSLKEAVAAVRDLVSVLPAAESMPA